MMTSRAVGLYSPVPAGAADAAAGVVLRFPRARPEPRVLLNVPNCWVFPLGGTVALVSAAGASPPD